MQQTNFNLFEYTLDEQLIQEQDPNKQINKDSGGLMDFNPLGLSLFLEANNQQEVINKKIFAQILKMIEDKLLELEQRLDNRDEIKYINSQINMLKPADYQFAQKQNDDTQSEQIKQRKFSQQSDFEISLPQAVPQQDQLQKNSQKPLKYRSKLGRANTEITKIDLKNKPNDEQLHQKIEQFNKKLKLLTEQVNKIQQTEGQFSKKIEQQINNQLKDTQNRLIQYEKLFKQVEQKNQEVNENQRDFLIHLQQERQEINFISSELTRINDELKINITQIESNFLELTNQVKEQKNELILQKSFLESIDNDFLIMLKKFKDLQNELAKKKLNSSQLNSKLLQ
ncbi:unnamed protein product [Paramecium sonneborni]|uniref:Uncharacterized protein n=1 Tax=Paramecium sonneborni TaxID=65129 RepID=A0A8S1LGJ6_9CILI|nr:unnamed protein product [Paramecium sonneborni]